VIFLLLAALAVLGREPDPATPPDSQRVSLILLVDGGAGGLYLLMGAEFIAAVQIIVYGAQ